MKRLFSWIFPRDIDGSHSSELHDAYILELEKHGGVRARLWLFAQVVSILTHSLRLAIPSSTILLRRNARSAMRQLRSNTGYAILNVFGLALGLTAFIFLGLFASYETGFDSFHSKADRIYRVNRHIFQGDSGSGLHAQTAGMLGETMVRTFPEVESLVRIRNQFKEILVAGNESILLDSGFMVDSTFFEVFDFRMIQGSPASSLVAPFSIVLTDALAKRLFGTTDVLGEIVEFGDNALEMTVTGIAEPPPSNSHLQFEYLISWATSNHPEAAGNFGNYNNWVTLQMGTYFTLADGATPSQVEERFPAIMDQFLADRKHRYGFYLQPLSEVHLSGSNVTASLDPYPGNQQLVNVLMFVGILILCIAYVNFINLSTARAAQRSQEVGIRKAVGATRGQLIVQFVSESVFMSASAMGMAVTTVYAARPFISSVIDRPLPIPAESLLLLAGLIAATLIVGGVAAGLYPAIILSRFSPGVVQKIGKARSGPPVLRNLLVTVQFCISLILINGTIVVFRQTSFLQEKELGFDSEQLIQIPLSQALLDQFGTVKEQLLSHADVLAVSHATGGPSLGAWGMDYLPKGAASDEFVNLRSMGIDEDWFVTHGIQIIEGPSPREVFAESDELFQVYINETLRDDLITTWALPDVVGRQLIIGSRDREIVTIAGVVSDFHLRSVNQTIPPLIVWGTDSGWLMAVRISTKGSASALAHIKSVWETFENRQPLDYWFVDDAYRKFYEGDRRLMSVLGAFAGLAIAISLLGLFGLTAYAAEQRRSEIGIRKVLGATSSQIILMLAKSFTVLTLSAVIIATPVAYLGASSWLESFPYRISLSVGLFATSAFILVFVALLTVLLQARRAANAPPAESISS